MRRKVARGGTLITLASPVDLHRYRSPFCGVGVSQRQLVMTSKYFGSLGPRKLVIRTLRLGSGTARRTVYECYRAGRSVEGP